MFKLPDGCTLYAHLLAGNINFGGGAFRVENTGAAITAHSISTSRAQTVPFPCYKMGVS
jgi:hypothetical protein